MRVKILADTTIPGLSAAMSAWLERWRGALSIQIERSDRDLPQELYELDAPPEALADLPPDAVARPASEGAASSVCARARCACPGCRNAALGGDRIYCASCEEAAHTGHCPDCSAPLFAAGGTCPACGRAV